MVNIELTEDELYLLTDILEGGILELELRMTAAREAVDRAQQGNHIRQVQDNPELAEELRTTEMKQAYTRIQTVRKELDLANNLLDRLVGEREDA